MNENVKYSHSEKKHNYTTSSNIINGCKLNPDNIFKNSESLVPGETGKIHYSPAYSMTESFRPCRKLIDHNEYSGDLRPSRRKLVDQSREEKNICRESIRILPDQQNRRSETMFLPSVGWKTKKKILVHGSSEEYDVESNMNRKQRISSVEVSRNGIAVSVPGDKCYREVNKEPGFYKSGGLIPGSSIQLRETKITERTRNEFSTSKITVKPPLSTMTFADKLKMSTLQQDINEIEALSAPSVKLGQKVPSWEERTGFWLCRPEDEND